MMGRGSRNGVVAGLVIVLAWSGGLAPIKLTGRLAAPSFNSVRRDGLLLWAGPGAGSGCVLVLMVWWRVTWLQESLGSCAERLYSSTMAIRKWSSKGLSR